MRLAKIQRTLTIGRDRVTVDELVEAASGGALVELSTDPAFRERMELSQKALDRALERGVPVYGVTTGFGGSCGNRVSLDRTEKLGQNLIRYHGCGTGRPLGEEEVRAAMLCRMACLACGYSGVSMELLERLAALLNSGVTPVVPSEGSVGASGDLTPMSYVAACLQGEREAFFKGARIPAAEAFVQAGLSPYRFKPKEALALLNGTSVMTGIAAVAVRRSREIEKAASGAAALAIHALCGNANHFHPTLFEAKPFAGQARVAALLRSLLSESGPLPSCGGSDHLQDPYSLRCTPQVLGVLADALFWIREWVETEINSANDNPILDPKSGEVLMGGNFYGGHMALAMDSLKNALAQVADLADRQLALLVDPRTSRGLVSGLSKASVEDLAVSHGFKGAQITASALAAEAQKTAMPAAVFSRSTEAHNQDKVSLGTIAARDAVRMCELASETVAILLMAAARACRLRGGIESRLGLRSLVESVEELAPLSLVDEPLDSYIQEVARAVKSGLWGEKILG